ncbi:M1 family metallopeptidase [Thalassotalea sp. PS06]|uniref:M61 family metallopeptidase n=1 Tax=Thalassotalea sp. PS06 TaxID=2594005 RepID=UPI0011637E9B|nr:M1 family metallopeptidase [Thalassotalea sp. PS06]QDP01170.1 M1 family metallopeptidase [Thalassotalea sp. PS06]
MKILLILVSLLFPWAIYAENISLTTENIDAQQAQKVTTWLNTGVMAVETTLTPIPHSQVKITVKGYPDAMEPVPWGQILREQPIEVLLYVNPNMPLTSFVDDWTLYHELSHLYFPYLDYQNFWLSEGFATYMQYLSMFQGRIINQSQFVERIKQGLLRGEMKTREKPGKLNEVSADMWQQRAFKRVYWSGAAFFMEADLHLIADGNDLTEIIGNFSHCCLQQRMTGEELVNTLDKLSDTDIFSQLHQRYRHRLDFPAINQQQLRALAKHYQNKQPVSVMRQHSKVIAD